MIASTTAPLFGSGWDAAPAGPDAPLPHHLAEWVDKSAVAPALAAANLQSIAGPAVLEALAGDRLEQIAATPNRRTGRPSRTPESLQYATGPVARLLRPLEPIAAAGGWWCSGLDLIAPTAWPSCQLPSAAGEIGWQRPMAWGCFKPDAPRQSRKDGQPEWNKDGTPKLQKYEHPTGTPTRCWWLKVPAAVAQLVADRHGLTLPAEVAADHNGDAGAFWRWWAQTPALPLLITEGAKKAAALLSVGIPAVALPGIWNGSPKNPDTGRADLLADLAAVPLQDRPVWVLFDKSEKANPDEPKAARRLGRLLAKAGAAVLVGIVPGSHGKGADDHLAAGGTWEQLAEALKPMAQPAALPVLRRPDLIAPAGSYLGESVTIPNDRRVVALACAMGSGKTELIASRLEPLMAEGVRVVLVSHRRSLCEALADRLGLPWGADAEPGSDLRQTGLALCVDSLCHSSRLRFNPAEWTGAVVVIDEATAVLRHAVMATGTAIARRRVPVLQALGELLARASQVIVADAQMDNCTLEAIESAAGDRAYLISSQHLPAAGRQLTAHPTRALWYNELGAHLHFRRRAWVTTTAAEPTSANSAQNIAVWVGTKWPGARVLVVDAETVADPDHDASRLAANPNETAGRYDVVIATPAVAAGLSVTLKGHFEAVFVSAGGTTDPGAVAQAAGRVRDNCPRHFYAPARSPGNHLQIGCGSPAADRVLLQLQRHEQACLGQLAAAGWSATTNSAGPWLQLWAQTAAQQNHARLSFSATVLGLLSREGYEVAMAPDEECKCPRELQFLAKAETTAARDRVKAAEVLTDKEAAALQESRKRLSPEERAQLQRWRINRAWGLQGAEPSTALIKAHEDGAHRRVVFRWAITAPDADPLIAAHDRQQAQQQAPSGQTWGPDITRAMVGPRVAAARFLGLPAWLQRSDWFGADDEALGRLVLRTTTHSDGITQCTGVNLAGALGLKPGDRGTTVLRQLLALVGARLESRQERTGSGSSEATGTDRQRTYRVVVDPLAWRPKKKEPPISDAVTPEQVVAAWVAQLPAGAVSKNPLLDRGGDFETRQAARQVVAA